MTEPLRVAPEAEDGADNLTRNGAHELAARLDAYWHAKGHATVRHWVEAATLGKVTAIKLGGTSHGSISRPSVYVVRSNLVRGQPPR